MSDRDHAKALALLVGVVIVAIALWRAAGADWPEGWERGVGHGSTWLSRLLHPLVHGGLLHALVNVYVFWQVVFFCQVGLRHLSCAVVVACCCPSSVAVWPYGVETGAPQAVVGLSGVVFALLGMVMPAVAGRWRYMALLLVWQLAGWFFGTVAVGLHLWCFGLGLMLSVTRRVIVRR